MQETVQQKENSMRQISVEKMNLNIGTGEPGAKLEKAKKLLEALSGMKTVSTLAKGRIPTWGLRPGLEIGCRVTLRGEPAEKLLKRLLIAKKNTLKKSSFDNDGNFSLGIPEYLDIPDAEYDADVGIIGLEAAVTLKRKGFRIRRRTLQKRSIPQSHKITQDDAITFMKEKFGVKTE